MILSELISLLGRSGLETDAEQVLDILWLASVDKPLTLHETHSEAASYTTRYDRGAQRSRTPPRPLDPPAGSDTSEESEDVDETTRTPTRRSVSLYQQIMAPGDGATIKASPVSVPAGRALQNRLGLMRALRPLRQRWPSRQQEDIDEEGTVETTARAGRVARALVLPVFRPRWEAWFDVDVVVEDDEAMEVWKETLRDFAQMLRDTGAFRVVRSWRLRIMPDGVGPSRATLENNAGQRSLSTQLASPGVRRLIILATHGASGHWVDGRYAQVLEPWVRGCAVLLLQLMPPDRWLQTRLGDPHGLCVAPEPGARASLFRVEVLPSTLAVEAPVETLLPLAVAPLHAGGLNVWAHMQMARGRRSPVYLLDPSSRTGDAKPAALSTPRHFERAIAQLRHVSPEAFRLAVYLCTSPFTIPVARLVQAAKFHGSADQGALAEVLLSGLVLAIVPEDRPGVPRTPYYDMHPEARNILMRSLREADREHIADELRSRISEYIAELRGSPNSRIDFTPRADGTYDLPAWARPFAEVASSLVGITADAPVQETVSVLYAREQRFQTQPDAGPPRKSWLDLALGRYVVRVSEKHRFGRLESASPIDGSRAATPGHFSILRVEPLAGFAAALEHTRSVRSLTVYVPNLNVDVNRSVLRAAQLHVDLGIDLFLYLPRSQQGVRQRSFGPAESLLPSFLDSLNVFSFPRLNFLAKRLGAQTLLSALASVASQPGVRIEHVILLDPPTDYEDFALQVRLVSGVSRKVTVYLSSTSGALQAAERLHVMLRRIPAPAVDLIDASEHVPRSRNPLSSPTVLADIKALLTQGLAPEEREGLRRADMLSGGEHWTLSRHPARSRPHVFVSYVLEYEAFARSLVQHLSRQLEIDRNAPSLEEQDPNWQVLLDSADAVLAVVGSRTELSESALAQGQRAVKLGKPIIPVLIDPVRLIPELAEQPPANIKSNGTIVYLASPSDAERPRVIAATAIGVLKALRLQPDARLLEAANTYAAPINRYFNPPSEVMKQGRGLASGGGFAFVVSRLKEGEVLLGLYRNNVGALVATHLHSRARLEEMSKAMPEFVGYFALNEEVARGGFGDEVDSPSSDDAITLRWVKQGELRGPSAVILRMSWDSRGRFLATGSVDTTGRIWDVDSHKEVGRLLGHTQGVNQVVWAPSGSRIATSSYDRTIRVWSAEDWQCLRILSGHTADVPDVAWSPDGRRLASASEDGSIAVWSWTQSEQADIKLRRDSGARRVLWLDDGKTLATCWNDGKAIFVAAAPGAPGGTREVEGPGDALIDLAYSQSAQLLATCSSAGKIRVWAWPYLSLVTDLSFGRHEVRSVSFSSDGRYLAANSFGPAGQVRIWETRQWRNIARFAEPTSEFWPCSIAWSPLSYELASLGERDKIVRLWAASTAEDAASERPPKPGPILAYDDPQKGRWGGAAEFDGRKLEAVYLESEGDTFWLDLVVSATDGSQLQGPVFFHLHDSYPRSVIRITRIRDGQRAVLERVSATGVYTAGVQVKRADGQWMGLEFDLKFLRGPPAKFRRR